MNASRLSRYIGFARRILLLEQSREPSCFQAKTKLVVSFLCFFYLSLFLFSQGMFLSEAVSTERVSIATDGTQANADSDRVATSTDGQFVDFSSSATNLVSSDTNNRSDIFARDWMIPVVVPPDPTA